MSFSRLLSEATAGELPRTGDVLAVGLPLLRDIDALHHDDRVTGAAGVSRIEYDGTRLFVRTSQRSKEQTNRRAVDAVSAQVQRGGIEVTSHNQLDLGDSTFTGRASSLDVFDPSKGRPERPMFVPGYQVWEQLHGHHDQLTDIAMAGQWLCSYAFGLDLDTPEGIDQLALHHRHPNRLNPHLHPVVAGAIMSMVNPDRTRRPGDIAHVVAQLEHHRDLPADLDLSEAYASNSDWRSSVLSTLRDRVFDTTRRNRQLYFRPTQSSVSLTEASVPLMLNVDRIKPKDLLTWTDPSNAPFRKGKDVDLASWCRFEESPYLAPALDKLISAGRKFRVESGHGRLQLIIAFLHWHDPETGESVSSPLLTMPAVLVRKKGVTTRYRLGTPGDEATVNPILRHVFASRFDIVLPARSGTSHEDIVALASDLEAKVRASTPGVEVELIDRPRIGLLRKKAQLRVDTYRQRRARNMSAAGRWRRQDHSYQLDDWRPLGRSLYDRYVRIEELPLRDIAGATPRTRTQSMVAATDVASRTSDGYSLSGSDVSANRWQVDLCSVTLAMLGSRRTNLSRDYDDVLAGSDFDVTATPFESLFRPGSTRTQSEPTEKMHVGQRLVLPADEAQARAVQRALRGDSFIIQGPPGTGKSQTISNVIAALAAEGRRVLFVCEKRAAIDVVAHRLHQVGLSELTATIHDSQLDRKDFVKELGATYHSWLEEHIEPNEVSNTPIDQVSASEEARTELLARFSEATRPLEAMAGELARPLGADLSISDAIERMTLLSNNLTGDTVAVDIETETWLEVRPTLERVEDALATSGLHGPLGHHLALRVQPKELGGDPIAVCRNHGRSLADALDGLDTELTLADFDGHGRWSEVLGPAAAVGALVAFDSSSPKHLDLRTAAKQQQELKKAAEQTSSVLERWSSPLSLVDTKAGLDVARAKEGSFFKFFNRRWRALRTTVEAAYRFDDHQVAPSVTSVLEDLMAHHEAVAALDAHQASSVEQFGSADAAALRSVVDDAHGSTGFTMLVESGAGYDELAAKFASLRSVTDRLLVDQSTPLGDLQEVAAGLQSTSVAVEPALVAWSSINRGHEEDLAAVLDARARLDEIEVGVLRRELELWGSSVSHDGFSGARIDDAVATARQIYAELLACNADCVVEKAKATFWESVSHSEASMAGRSDADKERKRQYKAGRKIVEREYEKKMRHRSIREMSTGESGVVVRDLRPIWLMSPLSVSDTLPLESDLFDVVIFDEASQIPVEDALPSVFRAPQVIVVGDRMQMPPTRFFSSDDADEGEVIVDEDGHRMSVSLDADSFLTQADGTLESAMLNWHYRSRSESLIAYSNHAFYAGGLATIPDTALSSGELPSIDSDSADDASENTAATLERPISFHLMEHGEYRDRRNVAEADYIAELVRGVLQSGSGHTIGIVAFSEAQQAAIENALDELSAIDPAFAEKYEDEQMRVDDAEFVGLFVKNLENVQGDERDLIIMSVCYGPDANGKIRMNFGPINNAGGERRLNVIFSRARQHMAVVASMRGNQITNLHNEGASHLAGFLSYAEAESVGHVDASTAILRSKTHGANPTVTETSPVAAELARRLGERGWTATANVGRSAFRVDVAIAVDEEYKIGVLLEPGRGAEGVARYVAEAGVLSAFGWRIIRVPLSDWLEDSERVVERVHVAVAAGARRVDH